MQNGETFERNGATFRFKIESDDSQDFPWDREDGHGPVRQASRSEIEGLEDEPTGERILYKGGRGEHSFVYDWDQALQIAARDGWNAEPYDAPNAPERAVKADFDRLADFLHDRWNYVGVIVERLSADGERVLDQGSLWGIESDAPEYHVEVANELADEMVPEIGNTNDLGAAWGRLAAAGRANPSDTHRMVVVTDDLKYGFGFAGQLGDVRHLLSELTPSLAGVSRLTDEDAEQVRDALHLEAPETGPYRAVDYEKLALEQEKTFSAAPAAAVSAVDAPSAESGDKLYGYSINLDERGYFAADVRDEAGKTVYEIRAGASLPEDESNIFEDGFMRHKNDVAGLTAYLRDLKFIPADAEVVPLAEQERRLEEAESASVDDSPSP